MLIHEVAQVTKLPISTIRYYEQEGLLNEQYVRRNSNGYRSYTQHAVERLEHLKRARAAGLTVAEIKKLTILSDNGMLSTEERREFLQGKIVTLSEKITALEATRESFAAELERLAE